MIPVKPHIAEGAHINSMDEYQRLYRQSLDDPRTFWSNRSSTRAITVSIVIWRSGATRPLSSGRPMK